MYWVGRVCRGLGYLQRRSRLRPLMEREGDRSYRWTVPDSSTYTRHAVLYAEDEDLTVTVNVLASQ